MGQKVNPRGFRLIVRKDKWRSKWFATKREYGEFLIEDAQIRAFIMKQSCATGISEILIRRMSGKVEITVRTARPGYVIGKKGAGIEQLKKDIHKLTGKDIWLEVEEIKRPDLEAQLVADGIARQLERRIPFRRAMKKALQSVMDSGAAGVKVQVSGRLGGAEIARAERYQEGSTPLHTLRADIDYAIARAGTTYGIIGVKVWIHRGEDSVQMQRQKRG